MRIIDKVSEGYEVFEALGSKLRLSIVELLLEHHELRMNDIAKYLKISQSTLTPHIKKLENAGIITTRLFSESRGSQKLCKILEDKIILEIIRPPQEQKFFEIEANVGQYFDYNLTPTCGLASTEKVIGYFDDPRYFSDPERFTAGIIWFSQGFVKYKVPSGLTRHMNPVEMQISMELCSEAPGVLAHCPSDIYFSVNDVKIGYWTSPGEMFDRPGRLTPSWWFRNFSQYGIMKILTINETGSYLDGLLLSSVKIQDLHLYESPEISLKIEVPKDARNIGGLTLFGKNFGDYDSGIKIKVLYNDI